MLVIIIEHYRRALVRFQVLYKAFELFLTLSVYGVVLGKLYRLVKTCVLNNGFLLLFGLKVSVS